MSSVEERANTYIEPTTFHLNAVGVNFNILDEESKTIHWFCAQWPLKRSQLKARLDVSAEIILIIGFFCPMKYIVRPFFLQAALQPIARFTSIQMEDKGKRTI